MPYTLSMGLLWVALAVVLGVAMGWLMRSVVAKRQIERARSNHLDNVELERLRARVAELEPGVVERDQLRAELDDVRAELDACRSEAASGIPPVVAGPTDTSSAVDAADVSAAAVLGRPVDPDDLTVIEGIGPKIAELCVGIGIVTWRDLAQTEVSLLRTMLHDAGPRFRSHDPSTWPEQASLLADGRWADFRALTEQLTGGSAR